MLLQDPLTETIIYHIAEKQDFTVQSLHKLISKKEKISLSQFYKIIDNLIQKQILSKEGGHLKLHLRWMLALSELNDIVKKNYYDTSSSFKIELAE